MVTARYDGMADWYDAVHTEVGDEAEYLVANLGDGQGQVCLDVGCGTGRYGGAISRAGYVPIGVDASADQLRVARGRLLTVQGDALRLPMADGSLSRAIGMYLQTDVEDFAGVVREVARCLRRGGRFVYVGVHPCFIGPFVDRTTEVEDDELTFVPGYGASGWAARGSGSGDGLWSRVGGHHKTLAEFMEAFAKAALCVRAIREFSGGGAVLPRNLGVVAEKL